MKTMKTMIFLVAAVALLSAGPLMADGGDMDRGNGNMMMGQEPTHRPAPSGPGNPAAPANPVNPPGITPQAPPQTPSPPMSPMLVWQMPYQPVSPEERQGLIQMRQEIKLVRDVSLALYNRWQLPVFLNNANAWQAQMDNTKALMDKYHIADPMVDNTPGIFADPHYMELYNTMVAKGMTSLENAFSAGANMEDRVIYTMNNMMALTDNADMMVVYQYMMAGSQGHMKTFVGMMEGQGIPYNPQYISHDQMEQIMSMTWQ